MTKTLTQKSRKISRGRLVASARGSKSKAIVVVPPKKKGKKKSPKKASFGYTLGGRIGSYLGHGLQQVVSRMSGFGSYRVSHNSLMAGGMSPPQIVNSSSNGGFIVRHREYITDITASIGFISSQYAINPGVSATFPWLSQLAVNFEEYSIRGMIFEFKTMSSDVVLSSNATTALGSVVMATQYDALDAPFSSKRVMENYEFACSAKPSVTFDHPIECKRSLDFATHLYVRSGTFPGDRRLYDLGIFQIATTGMQANAGVIGELWASYEVELYKPKIGYSTSLFNDHYQLTNATSAAPFGTVFVPTSGSFGFSIITGTTITWPVSDSNYYKIDYYIHNTSSTATTMPAITTTQNTVLYNLLDGSTLNSYAMPNATVSTSAAGYTFFVKTGFFGATTPVLGVAPIITLGSGTFGTVNWADLFITLVPAPPY